MNTGLDTGRWISDYAKGPLMFVDDDSVVIDRGLPGLWKEKYASRRLGAVVVDLPNGIGPMECVYSHSAVERLWEFSERFEVLWSSHVGSWIRSSLAPAIGLPVFECTPEVESAVYGDIYPVGNGAAWWKEGVVRYMISRDYGRRFVWLDAHFISAVIKRFRRDVSEGQSVLVPIRPRRAIDDLVVRQVREFEEYDFGNC